MQKRILFVFFLFLGISVFGQETIKTIIMNMETNKKLEDASGTDFDALTTLIELECTIASETIKMKFSSHINERLSHSNYSTSRRQINRESFFASEENDLHSDPLKFQRIS